MPNLSDSLPNICNVCDVEHKVIVPCVHLNGSDPTYLRDGLSEALYAITTAIARVVEAAPNGRDYCIYDRGAIGGPVARRAMQEHESRCKRLNDVMDEIKAMRDHVQAVLDLKEQRRAERLKR